ncbi:response regulator transcription factor [Thalassotalea sp. ND16A]|uniref:response regulator transcription factor n=1 Tax=Thalassotalea sp. ND16A TaxID=1535422 RepID=UPI00051A79C9|nr:response regulator transcription factor [Thalassotalea sp. ND16A]KGJ98149.1 response regulator receiver protein [Thalassotalea sp. ND16A]
MTSKHLLLIDDDQELAELLNEFLASEGYQVSCCFDGISGLQQAKTQLYDLILLDVMMPGLSGFELLKALGGKHHTPILMLTAKGDDTDRVLGLELGADDYLAKPYNPSELLARIKAILRRVDIIENKDKKPALEYNQVLLKNATREVFCHQQSVALTGTEFEMLHLLMENLDAIVSKEQLSEQVLNRPLSAYDRSIDMHISNIRRKLQQHSALEKIKTIRGVGYVFMSGDR